MVQDGPNAIALAYARLSWNSLKEGDLRAAIELMNRAHEAAPSSAEVNTKQLRLARYQALDVYLTSDVFPEVRKVRLDITSLAQRDVNTANVVVPLLARDYAARINSTADADLAARLARAGREIFGSRVEFRGK
jgi:hypothetical protein